MPTPKLLSLLCLACAATSAQATVYLGFDNFISQLNPGYYTETFEGYEPGGNAFPPVTYSGNGFSFTVDTSDSGDRIAYVASGANSLGTSLSNFINTSSIVLDTFSPNAQAFGSYFLLTDQNGLFDTGSLTVQANYSGGGFDTQVLSTNASLGTFTYAGFIAPMGQSILSITITGAADQDLYPTIDTTITSNSVVPEPSTYAALAGLAVLGLAVGRKRGWGLKRLVAR